jgi:hypothetical protein
MTRKDDKVHNRPRTTSANSKNPKIAKDDSVVKATRTPKERVTFQLPVELIEKARDVVYFTPGLTMARLMEDALVAQLKWREKSRGQIFPSRAGAALRTGRPVKSS